MTIVEMDLDVIEEIFSKTNEINSGYDRFDRSFFQISDDKSTAYAVVYDLRNNENDCPELARFFVPSIYRNNGFGMSAAIYIINHIFNDRTQLLIDPVNSSVDFWGKVFESFGGSLDYEEIFYPKGIWHKCQRQLKN
ncbi:MAG TPA: hypothetical protein VJY83_02120 [Thiopseudomonas sp.]|nr:hypothetical protein [Thiopseudomonas sp.]